MRLTIFNIQHSDFGIYKCVGRFFLEGSQLAIRENFDAWQFFNFGHHLIFITFRISRPQRKIREAKQSPRYGYIVSFSAFHFDDGANFGAVMDGHNSAALVKSSRAFFVIKTWSPHQLNFLFKCFGKMTNIFHFFFSCSFTAANHNPASNHRSYWNNLDEKSCQLPSSSWANDDVYSPYGW